MTGRRAAAAPGTATGSLAIDLVAFGLLASVLLVSAPRLRVYHRITVMDVRLERVWPDGSTEPVEVPRQIGSRRLSLLSAADAVPELSAFIRAYAATDPMVRDAVPGTRFRWTVTYGQNSPRLDRTSEIVIER
jgi:hypothetical protein